MHSLISSASCFIPADASFLISLPFTFAPWNTTRRSITQTNAKSNTLPSQFFYYLPYGLTAEIGQLFENDLCRLTALLKRNSFCERVLPHILRPLRLHDCVSGDIVKYFSPAFDGGLTIPFLASRCQGVFQRSHIDIASLDAQQDIDVIEVSRAGIGNAAGYHGLKFSASTVSIG